MISQEVKNDITELYDHILHTATKNRSYTSDHMCQMRVTAMKVTGEIISSRIYEGDDESENLVI